MLRSFETSGIPDGESAILEGLSEWSYKVARNPVWHGRVRRFHERVNALEPVTIDDGTYVQMAFSAVSVDGLLIAGRFRTSGEQDAERFAVATGTVYEDRDPSPWRQVESYVDPDGALQLIIDNPVIQTQPNLTVVDVEQNPIHLACMEAERQIAEHDDLLRTTRVRLGKTAWEVLRPGYVRHPLESTTALLDQVARARLRGVRYQSVVHENESLTL